jgi:phosphate transport system permease protein
MALAGTTDAPIQLVAQGAVARRQALSRASNYILLAATMVGVGVLVVLMWDTLNVGASRLDWDFLTTYPSRNAANAGLRSSIIGTAWVLGLTILFAIPVAVGSAVFIEVFAPKKGLAGKVRTIVSLNIANLAGVPSIIYGILGLTVFVRLFGMGGSILAGALTLSLMILPMTIIASAEAIRQVPPSIRDGSLALGATEWQTVWYHTLPNAIPGIMTGVILAVARAAGETAALIMIGAFAFIAFDNTSWNDNFTVIPVQIYNWTIRPGTGFAANAAAGIVVLMTFVVSLNLIAVIIRERFRRKF